MPTVLIINGRTEAMKKMMYTFIMLAASLMLLAGCEPLSSRDGKLVKFKATSKSQPATKTVYAGNAASTGKSHEDIYWSDNDAIRIYSGNTAVVAPESANYSLVVSSDRTKATLQNPQETPNGLAWVNDAEGTSVTFYAVYPPATQGAESGWFTMSMPSDQSYESPSSYKDPTEIKMDHAYMLAQNTLSKSEFNETVSLEFYPAFTAFQINLKSADDELTLKKFRIFSEDDNYLAGSYNGKLIATTQADLENEYFAFNTDKTLRMDFAYPDGESLKNEVYVEFPYFEEETDTQKNIKISPSSAVDFTLLTLPGVAFTGGVANYQPYQTSLWLEVTFLNGSGDSFTKKLALKRTTSDGTDFIKFASCRKHRINGLAVDGGARWRLTINGEVLPWDYDLQKTTFSQNVQAKAFYVDGSLETLPGYTDAQTTIDLYGKKTSNHYEAYDTGTNTEFKTYEQWVALGSGQEAYNFAHNTYYQLYYQLRRLDMAPSNPHFEVTFTPMAPLGGYWTLSTASAPSFGNTNQGGPEGFRIVLWDGESELDNWSSGQIMNQEVTLRIYPSAQRDPSKEYCMLIKASFSPNKNGEPSYSADSELQDVHGDGKYSYWKFVIPATE